MDTSTHKYLKPLNTSVYLESHTKSLHIAAKVAAEFDATLLDKWAKISFIFFYLVRFAFQEYNSRGSVQLRYALLYHPCYYSFSRLNLNSNLIETLLAAPVVIRTLNKVTTESLHLGRNIKNKSVLCVMGDLDIEQGKCAKWLTRISVCYFLAI